MSLFKRIGYATAVIAAAVILFPSLPSAVAGPGGNGHGHGHGANGKKFGEPGKAAEVDRVVRVRADGLSYELEETRFRVGETVKFVITNVSGLPHDFTLGNAATQAAHRKEMAEMIAGDGMSGHMDHNDGNAVFLKPGETKALIWKFTRTGQLKYGCNVPGHYEAGMEGPIVVSQAPNEPHRMESGRDNRHSGSGHHGTERPHGP